MTKSKRDIIAIVLTVFYIVMLLLDQSILFSYSEVLDFSLRAYLEPLIAPMLCLGFFIFQNKSFPLKNWLLPLAFVLQLAGALRSVIDQDIMNYDGWLTVDLACWIVMAVALACMVAGSLLGRRDIGLVKYGALGCAVLYLAASVAYLIETKTFFLRPWCCFNPYREPCYSYMTWLDRLAVILFYLGIFLWATQKRRNKIQ